nr:hypothetical protein [Dyella sp. ASV24]
MDSFKQNLLVRINHLGYSSAALIFLIFSLVFGFLTAVVSFEYLVDNTPKELAAFSDQAWRLQDDIQRTESNIKSLIVDANLPGTSKTQGLSNNVASLSESIRAADGSLSSLKKAVYENHGKISETYFNGRRILFVLSSIFIAYLVKLLAGLYKYNAYLRAHYQAILDAVELSVAGSGEAAGPIDAARLREMVDLVGVRYLKISEDSIHIDALIEKVGIPKAKK